MCDEDLLHVNWDESRPTSRQCPWSTSRRCSHVSGSNRIASQIEALLGDQPQGFTYPKTPGSMRRIALPGFLLGEMAAHIAQWPPRPDRLVFTAAEGGPLRRTNFRRRDWLPAVAGADIEHVRFHDLRQSHASMLIAQGEHPKLIADRLGHSSPNVTMAVYAHLFPGLDVDAADRLDVARAQSATDPTRTQQGSKAINF